MRTILSLLVCFLHLPRIQSVGKSQLESIRPFYPIISDEDDIIGSSEDVTEVFEDSNSELLTEFDDSFEDVLFSDQKDFYEPLEEENSYSSFLEEENFIDHGVSVPQAFENIAEVFASGEEINSSNNNKDEEDSYNEETARGDRRMKGCLTVEKVVYEEKCEPVPIRTCFTQHIQTCNPITRQNCTAEVRPQEKEECTIIEETFCSAEHHEDEYCPFKKIDICDTVVHVEVDKKSEKSCLQYDTLNIESKKETLEDVTCVFSSELKCKDLNEKSCQRTPTQKCYKTPRQVRTKIMSHEPEKGCKTLQSTIEKPILKKECRAEMIRKCQDAEELTECKKKPKKVCSRTGWEVLEKKCKEINFNECKYDPQHTCHQELKEECRMVEHKIYDFVCDKNTESSIFYL